MNNQNDKIRVLLMTSTSTPGFHMSPPIGLHRLRHYLEQNGLGCDILDSDFEPEDRYLDAVEQGRYDIVGMSVSHYNMSNDLEQLWKFQKAAKNSDRQVLFIAGGQEAALNYEQWLDCGFDLVVLGFAERILLSVCQRYASNRRLPLHELLSEQTGVAFYDDHHQLVFTPAPKLTHKEFREFSYSLMMDIQMPYLEYWERVSEYADKLQFNQGKFVVENVRLFTSSHCPRRCGFCSSQSFLPQSHGGRLPVLYLSADEIYQLVVRHVRHYGAKGFLFSDDDFLIGTGEGLKRARQFCKLIIDAKEKGELPKDIIFNCQSRVADFMLITGEKHKKINHDLIDLLARAGFHSFGLGVETFSDRLMRLPSINKLGVTVADCHSVLNALLAAEFCPQINIILGIPESTVEEILETIDYASDYVIKGCQVAVTAYIRCIPGAPIYGAARYETIYVEKSDSSENRNILIADYFQPENPEIAMAMASLQENEHLELHAIKNESGYSISTFPKSAIGLAKMAAIARALGDMQLNRKIHQMTIALLQFSEENDGGQQKEAIHATRG